MKSQKIALTLVTYIVLALSVAEASSHSTGGVGRRDHTNLKRLVKKRSPFPQTGSKKEQNLADLEIPVNGVGTDPTDTANSSLSASASASVSASSGSVSQSQSASSSASSGSVSASSSASVSTSASASSSSSSTNTIATPTGESTTEIASPSKATVVLTSTAGLPQETTNPAPNGAANKGKSTIITVLAVVAASVAAVIILWTVFRKWKLGSSKEFDQRLQPIDWQPTSHDDGDGIVPPHRRLSGSSFRSGISGARNYGSASDVGHGSSEYHNSALQPLPDHDFTAGPSLAPVGGYADLSRGPSPQPQMTERGPDITGSGYDTGLPLHHQSGYGSQDAYGGARY